MRVYRSPPLAKIMGMSAMRKTHLEKIITDEKNSGRPLSPDEREILEIEYGDRANTEMMQLAREIIAEGPTFDELDGLDQSAIWGHVNLAIATMTNNLGAGLIGNANIHKTPGDDRSIRD